MPNRRRVFLILAFAALSSLTLVATSGCAGAFLMPYYLIYGTDAPAKYADEMKQIPKESKMVVICRSNLNLFGSSNPNADLAQSVTYVVSTEMKDKKKKKLEWIPYSEVEDKFDEEELNASSFEKLGAKLKADYVIGIDIETFDVHHSTQFYQGNSKVLVRLVDVKEGEILVRESMPTYAYPPTPIPISDYEEIEFQKTFTVKLAKRIGTLFCPHDPHDQYAEDSDFPNR